jgi:phosphate acetyltransferase
MATGIYIAGAESFSGKSTIALGLVDALAGRVGNVGVFRPVVRSGEDRDYVLELLLSHGAVTTSYDDSVGVRYDDVHQNSEQALSLIVARYRAMEKNHDFVVILGSDYTDVGNPTEFSFNAVVAANLGAPVVLVVTGRNPIDQNQRGVAGATARPAGDIARVAQAALAELRHHHATPVAVIANRADPDATGAILESLRSVSDTLIIGSVPESKVLVSPTIKAVTEAISGTVFQGDPEALEREALGVMVAAMSVESVVARLKEGHVVLVPGDRTDVILAVLLAHQSEHFPSLAGMVLYGGFEVSEQVKNLLAGVDTSLPIILTDYDTYESVLRITSARGRFAADSQRKYDTALALFRDSVDIDALLGALEVTRSTVVTPLMFEYDLLEKARANKRRIVLPEGDDDRIIRAAATLLVRGVVDITLLGDEPAIRLRASELGLDLGQADIVSVHDPELVERFATEYSRLRAHKGVTVDQARDLVTDPSVFGTMMVHRGLADGMVSGAAHTTAHTITPAFQIIQTRPGVSIVSSVFFMCLEDRVLVYGDCAIVPEPTDQQLADIAISSAETAQAFGVEALVAMLSYSSGESGHGEEVERVRRATQLVRNLRPDIVVEGPIQYDAAAEPSVGASKMPGSPVAGRATVFIFPDLNTGNNTYKAVQRSAGAVAIGPVLQGLNKPVNDLSRGATVRDIVNTVAITAIQAASQP